MRCSLTLLGDVHGAHYDKYERLREKRVALEAWERRVAAILDEQTLPGEVVPLTRARR